MYGRQSLNFQARNCSIRNICDGFSVTRCVLNQPEIVSLVLAKEFLYREDPPVDVPSDESPAEVDEFCTGGLSPQPQEIESTTLLSEASGVGLNNGMCVGVTVLPLQPGRCIEVPGRQGRLCSLGSLPTMIA